MDQRAAAPFRGPGFEYRYLTEFQSHEPEFDYLKSLEIEEKINRTAWCRTSQNVRMLLSTNDKTIKLWKVHEKKVTSLTNFNVQAGYVVGTSFIAAVCKDGTRAELVFCTARHSSFPVNVASACYSMQPAT